MERCLASAQRPGKPVAQLRAQADILAREIRELDIRIQQANWEFDLLE
jgi:hypothetical protein